MRTTVTLEDDVAAVVARMRRERGIGVSEAVNELARAGLTVKPERKPFVQRTHPGRLLIDITNIGEALEVAEGPDHS
jgi:hypothetical protein